MTQPGMAGAGLLPGMPLLPAVTLALAAADGRVALRLAPAGPLTGPAHCRRAAKALLQDAALTGGGQVFETASGDLLLLAAAPAAHRVAAILARLATEAPPPETWVLPADNALLLAWAEDARLSPPVLQGPAEQAPGLAGLDALLDRLPLDRVVRRQGVLWDGAPPALAARRLAVSRTALRAALGALAPDADLLRHAEDRIAARLSGQWLAGGVQDPGGIDADPAIPLLVPLPLLDVPEAVPRRMPDQDRRALSGSGRDKSGQCGFEPYQSGQHGDGQHGRGPLPGRIGVLPLTAAADPATLARRRAALAASGWGLALGGLDAAALRLANPAALAADLLLLRWSPALADRAATAALRGGPGRNSLAPGRVVLTGCDGPEAMAWGRAVGIRRFAGPQVAALLTAARQAACPAAPGCSRRQCADRAAAIDAAGRARCGNPALLAALLPGAAA